MQRLLPVLVLLLGISALFAPSESVEANGGRFTYTYRVSCDPGRDVVELTSFDTDIDLIDKGESIDTSRFGKDQPVYSPEQFINLEGAERVAEGKLNNEDYGVHWASIECPLSRGIVKLEFLPELITQHPMRVDDISFSIWLHVAGRRILDDVPIRRCEDEAIIYRILYDAAHNKLLVESYLGNQEGSDPSTPSSEPLQILARHFSIESNAVRVIELSDQVGLDWNETKGPLKAEHLYRRWVPPPGDVPELFRCSYSRPGGPLPRRW
ncbi:MAG: hypothetical protein AB7P52_13470 [Alphaproteobacteria bacterium]